MFSRPDHLDFDPGEYDDSDADHTMMTTERFIPMLWRIVVFPKYTA